MTVAELIEKLKTFDQSLPVWLGETIERNPIPVNCKKKYDRRKDRARGLS